VYLDAFSDWLKWRGGPPTFRIHGKGRRERSWRIIDVIATARRDWDSRWPLWQGTCITWTAEVIAVGWDFARGVLREQMQAPASRRFPVSVAGGRLGDIERRQRAGGADYPSFSEILAHECGHTWQASRLGDIYLPVVGFTTLFLEGPRPWNHFENEASSQGLFGGIVTGSVCRQLLTIAGERRQETG